VCGAPLRVRVIDADGQQIVSNEVYRPGPDGHAVSATPMRTEALDDVVLRTFAEDVDDRWPMWWWPRS
jgi:pilus assembly protein CpaF